MTPKSVERYARHLVLKEIGGAGQQSLLSAKVVIVGAGGLGGPAALYLAAAGVGHITLIDDDSIERSNLQRQIQFREADLGLLKAEVTAEALRAQNPDVTVTPIIDRVSEDNAAELLSGHDLILDGVDNFKTRYVINTASLALKTPLISGAVGRWDGQVSAYASDASGPCYRCFVSDIPPNAEDCNTLGVVGAIVGVVGSVMSLEAIKIIVGAGDSLLNRLWIYDGLDVRGRTLNIPKDPNCPACMTALKDGH